MATPSQKIRVRKATRADIGHVVRIHEEAFNPGIMNRLLYPNGMTEDVKSKLAAGVAKTFDDAEAVNDGNRSKPKPTETFVMIAEIVPEAGQPGAEPDVIAFATWTIRRESLPEAEWNVPPPMTVERWGEGARLDVVEDFMGGIHAMRRRRMKGDPAMCLQSLCCTPSRGRLGAGSALLRWGCELADKEGLGCWLEGSPIGYPLYKRFGFEDVEVLDTRIGEGKYGAVKRPDEDWGANAAVELAGATPEGVYRSVGMWRSPVKRE